MSTPSSLNSDLTDSAHDAERLKADTGTLDLPEWNDIPGGIRGSVPTGQKDITAASADEEGDGILDDPENDEDVSELDEKLLDQPYDPSYDPDLAVDEISLDNADADGDRLEEDGPEESLFGKDLDDNLEEEQDEEDMDSNENPE